MSGAPGADIPDAAAGAVRRAAKLYRERFGDVPEWAGYAPGRVNLIGEHTDYNGGFVLPLAIDRSCVLVAGRALKGQPSIVVSADTGEVLEFDVLAGLRACEQVDHPGDVLRGGPLSYVAGAVAGVAALLSPGGGAGGAFNLRMVVASDVPIGSGLSSSAALEVASAQAVAAAWGEALEKRELALLCQRAEHEFAGVPCGIMDQFASVFGRKGHALLIDCRSAGIEEIPLGPVADGGLLVVDTRVRHALAAGAYARRRRACERAARALGVSMLRDVGETMLGKSATLLTEEEYRCSLHVVRENARVLETASMLRRGDLAGVGRLLLASHASLRDDFRVSCDELDVLVEAAAEMPGVHGARMTGAGFGGCAIVLAEVTAVGIVSRSLADMFVRRFGVECRPFVVRAVDGAGAAPLPL